MYAIQNLISYFNMCKKDDLYHNVIEKILCNLDRLGDATIYEWANICFASPTTISRLSRKLGYANFSSFKTDLAGAYEAHKAEVCRDAENEAMDLRGRVGRYFTEYRLTAERFVAEFDMDRAQEIVDAICQFHHIRLYSTVLDVAMMELQENLLLSGKDAIMLNIISEQLQDVQTLTKDTMVVFHVSAFNDGVQLSGIQQVVMEIKRRGASLILISDSRQPRYSGYADQCYSFSGESYTALLQQYTMFMHTLSLIYRTKRMEATRQPTEDISFI